MEQTIQENENIEQKTLSTELEELKKDLKRDLVFGTERVMKLLRANKLEKVYLASNLKETTRKDIMHYSNLTSLKVLNLTIPNDELGVFCKKQFSVSVIGVIKE
ncbi:MAG: ribosomal L7Ae/L30e/S12e/Gadd45 family protein [Candidatus Woesearchaeota archaeon]